MAIGGYVAFCGHNDWQPVFYQTMPSSLDCFQEAGFQSVTIGHEAIVDLARFSLDNSENETLREHVQRLTDLGHPMALHQPPQAPPLLQEPRPVSPDSLH